MRTIILTGGSDGIGAAAAEQLSDDHTRLILVGRSEAKTRAVAGRVGAEYYLADFERLDEVRDLAVALNDAVERIDVLANNAGGLFSGPHRTVDGFERTFQVNHLAPVLLTHGLMTSLVASSAAVVNTSSVGARIFGKVDFNDFESLADFRPNRAYGAAKLANVMFTKGLHERVGQDGLSSVAFHPGVIATSFASASSGAMRQMYHGVLRRFLTGAEKGGANLAHFIAGTPGVSWRSGEFYDARRRVGRTHRQAYDPEIVRRHWDRTAEMLGIQW